jgi:DHA2 family multidrug resistance protein
MDWRFVVEAGVVQGAGLGILLPALIQSAFSAIGIAVVLTCFYGNTQAMHVALAKDLTPFRAAAHIAGPIATTRLASLNDMITGQAALIAVIDQFAVVMIVMLIVAPLVLLLRKPGPADQKTSSRPVLPPAR